MVQEHWQGFFVGVTFAVAAYAIFLVATYDPDRACVFKDPATVVGP